MKTIPVRHINSAANTASQVGRFSIRQVQQVLNGKDLVHDLHRHDFLFVLALEKGSGVHEIDFISYEAHDQAVFILRPGQVHRLELKAGSAGFLMEFDLAFYQPQRTIKEQRWKKVTAKNYCEVEATRFAKLNAFLSNMFNEFDAKQEGYIEAIKANLDLFFIEYLRQSLQPNKIATTEQGYAQERFEELTELLEVNIATMKNVAQYADRLHLSAYQLNAITKAAVGKSVSELINEQIILEAKRFLLATNNQVKDIADQLGYEDVSYFIRFFKKHTAQTPDTFRKNLK